MKVIAFNGSPKKEGNTYHALRIVANELEREGIEVEIVHVGNQVIRGCIGCNSCAKNPKEMCVFGDDLVNSSIEKVREADGVLFGAPVHYAGIPGTMKSFMDRLFYVASKGALRHKVAAPVVAVRRSGGVTTIDQLNHFINYAEMLVPSTHYWNVIHGTKPGEVLEDPEGVQIMSVLGKNMAWLLKLVKEGKENIPAPEKDSKIYTNFIR